jgi:hypothetical protein
MKAKVPQEPDVLGFLEDISATIGEAYWTNREMFPDFPGWDNNRALTRDMPIYALLARVCEKMDVEQLGYAKRLVRMTAVYAMNNDLGLRRTIAVLKLTQELMPDIISHLDYAALLNQEKDPADLAELLVELVNCWQRCELHPELGDSHWQQVMDKISSPGIILLAQFADDIHVWTEELRDIALKRVENEASILRQYGQNPAVIAEKLGTYTTQ